MSWSQALTRVNPTVYDSVAALCAAPGTTVVVFSGSDKARAQASACAHASELCFVQCEVIATCAAHSDST